MGTETGDAIGAHDTRHGRLALMVETGTVLEVDTVDTDWLLNCQGSRIKEIQ